MWRYRSIMIWTVIVSLVASSTMAVSRDQYWHFDLMGRVGLMHLEVSPMNQNKDPSRRRFLFDDEPGRFISQEPDDEFLGLEAELRRRQKLHDPHVQWLMEKAAQCRGPNRQWARQQLRHLIESDRIMDMRTGDPFRPLAPPQLLGVGDLHLLSQVDGTRWMIPWSALPRGILVTGPQSGGKTRFIIHLCRQLNAADPPIPWFLVDPKLEFKGWASHLGAIYVDVEHPGIGIDLSPPPGLTYETWLPSLVPQIGDILGVIYGTEILQQAAEICMELRHRCMQRSHRPVEICLQDLYDALPFVKDVSSYRRSGYRDAVRTGLSRLLSGSGHLFRCRKGIDLNALFTRNVVFGTRSITDDFATQSLAFYILWWLHEGERSSPPSNRPKSVLIIDDGSRYVGVRDAMGRRGLSSLGSVLTTLRSSGRCFVAVSQVPHLIDPGVCALMQTVIQIGGLHHAADTQLVAKMMGLNETQRQALTSLTQREAVALCGGSAWPHAVHGRVPEVPDPVVPVPALATDIPELKTEPYENLFELISTQRSSQGQRPRPVGRPSTSTASEETEAAPEPSQDLAISQRILGMDIVTFMTSTVRQRQKRLGLSARQIEKDKDGLLNKDLIKEVWLGKNLMLAPTESLYRLLGMDCPYKRNAYDVHSYLVLLAAKLIEPDPQVKHVKTEVAIGDSSATVDLIVYRKEGGRWAYEIVHRSITNVSALAARLQDKGFAHICFLSTDFNVKERVQTSLRNAGFDADFLATVGCDIFSTLLRQYDRRRKQA